MHPQFHPVAAAVSAACLAWLAASAAHAQSGVNDVQLDEVRIYSTFEKDMGFAPKETETAAKMPLKQLQTPMAASVVTREVMESRQVGDLQEALQTTAGVSPVNYGRRGFDDIFIRGFDAGESILIDGLTQSGNSNIGLRLQPYGYERVEVLKGASSLLYGRVQPGGLVNAISKRPKTEAFGEVQVQAGSFGKRSLAFDINRPLSDNGKTALRINAIAANTDDPTDFVWRKDRWIAPSLSLDLGRDTDLVLFATFNAGQWIRQQGLPARGSVLPNVNGPLRTSLFTSDPAFGHYDLKQYTVGYNLAHRFSSGATLRQNLRYETESGTGSFMALQALNANQRTIARRASQQALDDRQIAIDTSVLVPFEAAGMRHQLIAGIDWRQGQHLRQQRQCRVSAFNLYAPQYNQPYTCPAAWNTDAPTKLRTVALYVQDQIQFGHGLTALGGLRFEKSSQRVHDRVKKTHTRQNDSDITGMAGIVWEFAPHWSAYTSVSQSFLPTVGQDWAGRPFKPETGQQWEAGLKHVSPGWTAQAAIFDLRRQNIPVADPEHDGYNLQVGEQRARGLELELGADLGSGLKLSAAYAYTDAVVSKVSAAAASAAELGKTLNYTPRHAASVWATQRIAAVPGLTLGAGLRHVGTQRGNLDFSLPAYTLVDLSASYSSGNWQLNAGVKNAFDRHYWAGAVRTGIVSPGMPRTFTATVKYFF